MVSGGEAGGGGELVRTQDPESNTYLKEYLQTIISLEEGRASFVSSHFLKKRQVENLVSYIKSPQFSNLGTHSKLFSLNDEPENTYLQMQAATSDLDALQFSADSVMCLSEQRSTGNDWKSWNVKKAVFAILLVHTEVGFGLVISNGKYMNAHISQGAPLL